MRKFIVSAIDGERVEVEIEPTQVLIALAKSIVYQCEHCTFERGDGTLVYHFCADEDESNWEIAIPKVKALQ